MRELGCQKRSEVNNIPRKGFAFIEVLISLVLIAAISTAFFSALGTASRSVGVNDANQTSKNLAEMQLEYLKGLPFDNSYLPAPVPESYSGYEVLTADNGRIYAEAVASRDSNIQKVSVTILREGRQVITVSGYKAR